LGSDASPRPLISVVVTVRNEAPHLPRLLDNLVVQEPPLEVVVVESESRDRTRAIADEYARRYPDLIRVFSRPGSRGIGRNIGVAEARGDLIAFIDGDCFPDSQWLHALRASAGAAAVLAGRTVTVGRAQYGHLERVELFQSGYDVTYPSCNLLYRRALFERLGGFDPRFITAEDNDLNLMAVRSGAAIRYVPTIRSARRSSGSCTRRSGTATAASSSPRSTGASGVATGSGGSWRASEAPSRGPGSPPP